MVTDEVPRALYYQDLVDGGVVGEHGYTGEARTFGVQILILSPDEYVLIRRDPDADSRYEGHFYLEEDYRETGLPRGRGYCPETKQRFNSAGGGVKPAELVEAAALRELKAELGEDLGEGTLQVLTELPLLACYQRWGTNGSGNTAHLMAVVPAIYRATEAETSRLQERGYFVRFENLLKMTKRQEANGVFRPTFRHVMWLVGKAQTDSKDVYEHWAHLINLAIVGTSLWEVEQTEGELHYGLFAHAVQYYLTADWKS